MYYFVFYAELIDSSCNEIFISTCWISLVQHSSVKRLPREDSIMSPPYLSTSSFLHTWWIQLKLALILPVCFMCIWQRVFVTFFEFPSRLLTVPHSRCGSQHSNQGPCPKILGSPVPVQNQEEAQLEEENAALQNILEEKRRKIQDLETVKVQNAARARMKV